MKNIFFFLPFFYFYITRIKSLPALINWIFIYIIPTFTLVYLMARESSLFLICVVYSLIVLAVYSIYEAGYIQNDTETIKIETYPTLRLSKEQLEFYEKHKNSIYLIRISLGILLASFALALVNPSKEQVFLVFSALSVIGLVYFVYNQVRNTFTLFLLFMLVSLRYITPLLIFHTQELQFYLWLIILLYPVLNLLDWTYKKRFKQYTLPFDKPVVRISYYALLSIVFGCFIYFTSAEQYGYAMILSIYFLLYRTVFWYLSPRIQK